MEADSMAGFTWNGKRYANTGEFCDEAGFHGKARSKFQVLISNGYSVDRALRVIYGENEEQVREHDILSTTEVQVDTFDRLCKEHNIKYKDQFYHLLQTYTLNSALYIYRRNEKEYEIQYNRDKVYSEKREKQSEAIYNAHVNAIRRAEEEKRQREIAREIAIRREKEREIEELLKNKCEGLRKMYNIPSGFESDNYDTELELLKKEIDRRNKTEKEEFMRQILFEIRDKHNIDIDEHLSLLTSYRWAVSETKKIDIEHYYDIKRREQVIKVRHNTYISSDYDLHNLEETISEINYRAAYDKRRRAEEARIKAEKAEKEAQRLKARQIKKAEELEQARQEAAMYKDILYNDVEIVRKNIGSIHNILWSKMNGNGEKQFKKFLNQEVIRVSPSLMSLLTLVKYKPTRLSGFDAVDIMQGLECSIPLEALVDILNTPNDEAFATKCLEHNIFGVRDINKFRKLRYNVIRDYVVYTAAMLVIHRNINISIPYIKEGAL